MNAGTKTKPLIMLGLDHVLILLKLFYFQLILGCAVNCEHKQEYIETIMGMDSSTQQLIMQAIQEILDLPVRTLSYLSII